MSIKEFKVGKSVNSYYFPEVRAVIDKLFSQYPHYIFFEWDDSALENFHVPIIERYINYQAFSVPYLTNFPFRYPIAGSDEGIREILTWLQAQKVRKIYVLEGEYGGYKAVAATRCIKTVEVSSGTNPATLEKGYWFISNPSARNGNIISNKTIRDICDAGHQVFYDMAYVGLTDPHQFDLSHPNIFAAVASLSKSFGLSSYRIGFAFTREEIPSLYGNIWFKSIFNLLIAEKVLTEINLGYIARKYKPIQRKIIQEINETFDLSIRVSDALLLGYLTNEDVKHLKKNQLKMIEPFQGKKAYRFGLSSYFIRLEE